jgi:hypothetical protein
LRTLANDQLDTVGAGGWTLIKAASTSWALAELGMNHLCRTKRSIREGLSQGVFNISELDTLAIDLNLAVFSPDVLNGTVEVVANQVSSSVELCCFALH